MKRPFKPTANYRATLRNLESELTKEQFEAIGRMAMRFNQAEEEMESLFYQVCGLPENLQTEVLTRINGIDGRVAIIKKGAEALGMGMAAPELEQLRICLGEGGFLLFKKYRDAVVHSRVYNAPMGIGLRHDRQSQVYEVLITKEALNALDARLKLLADELHAFGDLIATIITYNQTAITYNQTAADDPDKELFAQLVLQHSAPLQHHRSLREALPPLPEFPEEHELKTAKSEWWKARIAEVLG